MSIIAEARQVEMIERMRLHLSAKPRTSSGYKVTEELAMNVDGYAIEAGDTMWGLGIDTSTFYVSLQATGEQLTFKKQSSGVYNMKAPSKTATRAGKSRRMSYAGN